MSALLYLVAWLTACSCHEAGLSGTAEGLTLLARVMASVPGSCQGLLSETTESVCCTASSMGSRISLEHRYRPSPHSKKIAVQPVWQRLPAAAQLRAASQAVYTQGNAKQSLLLEAAWSSCTPLPKLAVPSCTSPTEPKHCPAEPQVQGVVQSLPARPQLKVQTTALLSRTKLMPRKAAWAQTHPLQGSAALLMDLIRR